MRQTSLHGRVVRVNPNRGMFVVQCIGTGEHCAIEILDSVDLAVGDEVTGPLEELGSIRLKLTTQGEVFDAYGQTGPTSLADALRCIL